MKFLFLLSVVMITFYLIGCNLFRLEPQKMKTSNKRARVVIGFKNGMKDTLTIEYCDNLYISFNDLEDGCEHLKALDIQYFSFVDSSVNIKK